MSLSPSGLVPLPAAVWNAKSADSSGLVKLSLLLRLSLSFLDRSRELQRLTVGLQTYALCMCENFVVLQLAGPGGVLAVQ